MADLLVNIDVDDLEKAIAFYTVGLGLRVSRRLGPDIAELRGASALVYLTAQPSGTLPASGSGATRDYRRHWTPIHLDFVVPELEPAIERARSAGAALEGGIREFAWGRYAVLADPFGHGFCVLQFKGRGYLDFDTPGSG
jgi:predicted enzyme related to lactoylglutathione lyase